MHLTTKNSKCICVEFPCLLAWFQVLFKFALSQWPPNFRRVAMFKVESKKLKILRHTLKEYATVRVAVCCCVLQCGAMWCSVVQCGAACFSILQFVAVCCSVLQCVAVLRDALLVGHLELICNVTDV